MFGETSISFWLGLGFQAGQFPKRLEGGLPHHKGSPGSSKGEHSQVSHARPPCQTLHGTAIYAYIDPSNHPNVGIYGIHGVSGTGATTRARFRTQASGRSSTSRPDRSGSSTCWPSSSPALNATQATHVMYGTHPQSQRPAKSWSL